MKRLSEEYFRAKSLNVISTAVDRHTRLFVRVRKLFSPQLVRNAPRSFLVVDHLANRPTNEYRPTKVQHTTRITHKKTVDAALAAAADVVDLANDHAAFAPTEEGNFFK